MDNRRIIDILDSYFNNLGGYEDNIPCEKNLRLEELNDISDDCFLIKVTNRLKFSFLGDNIIKAYGDDFFGDDINGLIFPENNEVSERIRAASNSRKPVTDEGEFENSDGVIIKYRQKLYPLTATEGSDTIDYIFGGMRWKSEV